MDKKSKSFIQVFHFHHCLWHGVTRYVWQGGGPCMEWWPLLYYWWVDLQEVTIIIIKLSHINYHDRIIMKHPRTPPKLNTIWCSFNIDLVLTNPSTLILLLAALFKQLSEDLHHLIGMIHYYHHPLRSDSLLHSSSFFAFPGGGMIHVTVSCNLLDHLPVRVYRSPNLSNASSALVERHFLDVRVWPAGITSI